MIIESFFGCKVLQSTSFMALAHPGWIKGVTSRNFCPKLVHFRRKLAHFYPHFTPRLPGAKYLGASCSGAKCLSTSFMYVCNQGEAKNVTW